MHTPQAVNILEIRLLYFRDRYLPRHPSRICSTWTIYPKVPLVYTPETDHILEILLFGSAYAVGCQHSRDSSAVYQGQTSSSTAPAYMLDMDDVSKSPFRVYIRDGQHSRTPAHVWIRDRQHSRSPARRCIRDGQRSLFVCCVLVMDTILETCLIDMSKTDNIHQIRLLHMSGTDNIGDR